MRNAHSLTKSHSIRWGVRVCSIPLDAEPPPPRGRPPGCRPLEVDPPEAELPPPTKQTLRGRHPPWRQTLPPVNGMTDRLKTLPCRKLRLRAVMSVITSPRMSTKGRKIFHRQPQGGSAQVQPEYSQFVKQLAEHTERGVEVGGRDPDHHEESAYHVHVPADACAVFTR